MIQKIKSEPYFIYILSTLIKPGPTGYFFVLFCKKSYAKGLFQHKYDIYFCSKLYNTAI